MFLPRPPVSCVFWLLFLSYRFYCPPVAEERSTHIFLCVWEPFLLTCSHCLCLCVPEECSTGRCPEWSHERAVSSLCLHFPQPRSLFFISIQSHTDLPSPHPLLHQRLQCEHSRAVTCLQACICAGHVVSRVFVFTWDYCCVCLCVWTGRKASSLLCKCCHRLGDHTSNHVVLVNLSFVVPIYPYGYLVVSVTVRLALTQLRLHC